MPEALASQLGDLRDELEAIALKREVRCAKAALEAERQLMEGWGDLVDPTEYLRDDPTFDYRPIAPVSQRSDRAQGQNRPVFETEADLAIIRGTGRLLHDAFPTAQCALDNLVSYVLLNGFTYKAEAQPGCPDGLAKEVQAVIRDFQQLNRWRPKEKEAFIRAHRDGEALLALFPLPEGRARLRIIEPAQNTEPADPRIIEDWLTGTGQLDVFDLPPASWSFGVHSNDKHHEDVYGYYCQWRDNEADWDYIPAAQMCHIKLNVDENVKRGVSDFYAVQQYLTNTGKLDRNVALGAAILSAIIGIREHAQGITRSQVDNLVQNDAWRVRTSVAPSGVRRNLYTQKIEPGSWLNVPYGQQYKQSPLANQGVGQAFVTIKQALLRTIGTKWSMPEYLISGDASNANYASTMVAESPFVRFSQRKQGDFSDHYGDLHWKVIRIAYVAGRFAAYGVESFEQLQAYIDLKIETPIVQARERDRETNRRKVLHDDGVISTETWAGEEGYDHEQEKARGAKRVQMTLPGLPPRGTGQSTVIEGWDPSKHPRDAHGRFVTATKMLWAAALGGPQAAGLADDSKKQKELWQAFPQYAPPKDPVEQKLDKMSLSQRIQYRKSKEYQKGTEDHLQAVRDWQDNMAEKASGLKLTRKATGATYTIVRPTAPIHGTRAFELRGPQAEKVRANTIELRQQFEPDESAVSESWDESKHPRESTDDRLRRAASLLWAGYP